MSKKYQPFELTRSSILMNFKSSNIFYTDSFGKFISFENFISKVKNIAYNLPSKSKKVVILAEKNSDNYAAILSILFLGKTWVPLSLDMPNNSIMEIIENHRYHKKHSKI